jgi:hypothetical protein
MMDKRYMYTYDERRRRPYTLDLQVAGVAISMITSSERKFDWTRHIYPHTVTLRSTLKVESVTKSMDNVSRRRLLLSSHDRRHQGKKGREKIKDQESD